MVKDRIYYLGGAFTCYLDYNYFNTVRKMRRILRKLLGIKPLSLSELQAKALLMPDDEQAKLMQQIMDNHCKELIACVKIFNLQHGMYFSYEESGEIYYIAVTKTPISKPDGLKTVTYKRND